MATLREQVLSEIRRNPNGVDNQSLAIRLYANEPSVRRVTLQLSQSGAIKVRHQDYRTGQIQWHVPPVVPQASFDNNQPTQVVR